MASKRPKNLLRIVSFNCNGIRSADRKQAAGFLSEMEPDLICFQEIRSSLSQVPLSFRGNGYKEENPDNRNIRSNSKKEAPKRVFQEFHEDWLSAEKKGYSGVGCLNRVECEISHPKLGHELLDIEGRLQRIDFNNITILNSYFPSGTAGSHRQQMKMDFLPAVHDYVVELQKEKRPIIFLGDFNIAHQKIDLKNWKSNQKKPGFLPEERAWLDSLLEIGFQDVIRDLAGPEEEIYSWWSQRSGARDRNVGWRIDYHWLWDPDKKLQPSSYQIPRLPVYSDHAPVVVDYHF